jgi:formylglycine-generating enzyme required for sulfatase activity
VKIREMCIALVVLASARCTKQQGGVGGLDCDQTAADPTRACVRGGEFAMPLWSAPATGWPDNPDQTDPRIKVTIHPFLMDIHETTNSDLSSYFQAMSLPGLPSDCGAVDVVLPGDGGSAVEISGWVNGQPPADALDHPAVCVTRAEAMAYCGWKGGHLPTVYEYMRAAGAPWPEQRVFPWGDDPPSGSDYPVGPFPDLPGTSYLDYAVINDQQALHFGSLPATAMTASAGSEQRGASADGIRGLAGNASEILLDCAEDLYHLGSAAEIDFPESIARTACHDETIGGANWLSELERNSFGATVFTFDVASEDGGGQFGSFEGSLAFAPDELWQMGHIVGSDGYERSWQVGFRCSYEPAGSGSAGG